MAVRWRRKDHSKLLGKKPTEQKNTEGVDDLVRGTRSEVHDRMQGNRNFEKGGIAWPHVSEFQWDWP